MKQLYKEGDGSVGWFKLALLVSRGEKEKALALYKLLSYSFEDKAYVLQVEGDLLKAFDDQQALVKYQQAALLYAKEKKISSAIALYEYLFSLQESNYESLSSLIILYAQLEWQEKVDETIVRLFNCFTLFSIAVDEKRRTIQTLVNSLDEIEDQALRRSIEEGVHHHMR